MTDWKTYILENVTPEPNTGCWLWTRAWYAPGPNGSLLRYGKCCAGSGTTKAHRLSWMVHFGPIPPGAFVCHKCDVPACVNPDHLWLGSPADNMRDKSAKGRSFVGERRGSMNPFSKLTEATVAAVRKRHQAGTANPRELAAEYGTDLSNMYRILNCRTWRHV